MASFGMARCLHVRAGDHRLRDIMRIGIIGTGVAGSLLADLLRDAPGIAVEAFERVAPGDHAEAGTTRHATPTCARPPCPGGAGPWS